MDRRDGTSAAEPVLGDIDGAYATFALGGSNAGIDATTIKRYPAADFKTATDCIQQFGDDSGIKLSGRRAAISVSGAVSGDWFRIARCPWIISARGFGFLFHNDVLVLNDSAAKVWAATTASAVNCKALSTQASPDFNKKGQWLGINFAFGLGAALLVSDGERPLMHLATEAGHAAFNPVGEAERDLHHRLAIGDKPVSWEQALFDQAGQSAVSMSGEMIDTVNNPRNVAEILGSFVGDLILSTGAWDGVVLFGKAPSLLGNPQFQAAYKRRVEMRANFQPQLHAVPQWTVAMPNINLMGAASYLAATVTAPATT